jgi:hypothetical protein
MGYTEGRRVQDAGVDTRVTISEAAMLLGISEGAVRKRVDRGSLRHDKGTDGKVYVYLPGPASRGTHGDDVGDDVSTPLESNALTSEMRSRIDFLEEELRRKDAILMNMTEAMKALTAAPETTSPEATGEPVTPSEHQGNGTGRTDEETSEKSSWWKRLFGG